MIKAALVRAILEQWRSYDWTVQGFGMVRTKLANVGRIHIWDARLKNPLVSDVHAHPWPFHSTIISGGLINVKFAVFSRADVPEEEMATCGLPYLQQDILTGEGGGLCKERPLKLVWLQIRSLVTYVHNQTYMQQPEEVHRSIPEDGTVTLLERPMGPPLERTQVYWPEGWGWVSAEPRKAADWEVERAVDTALARWFTG
jgi:hypothetical protein